MPEIMSLTTARRLISRSIDAKRPPVLVVGSGLLRQLGFGPFADWNTLMHEVACEMRVQSHERLSAHHPGLHWEGIVAQAPQMKRRQAWQREGHIQRHVCKLIRGAEGRLVEKQYQRLTRNTRLRSIITLNFTAAPFVLHGEAPLIVQPIPHFRLGTRIVWCPHGNAKRSRTICLGIRKYSALVAKLELERGKYHQIRQKNGRRRRTNDSSETPNLMHHVLESPLIFAGCGLRHAEWTLWWLLATKTRNEARHTTCPSIYLTGQSIDEGLSSALESMHCKVVKVDGYPAVWNAVMTILKR